MDSEKREENVRNRKPAFLVEFWESTDAEEAEHHTTSEWIQHEPFSCCRRVKPIFLLPVSTRALQQTHTNTIKKAKKKKKKKEGILHIWRTNAHKALCFKKSCLHGSLWEKLPLSQGQSKSKSSTTENPSQCRKQTQLKGQFSLKNGLVGSRLLGQKSFFVFNNSEQENQPFYVPGKQFR